MRIIEYKSDISGFDIKYILKNKFKMSASLISKLKASNGICINGVPAGVRHILDKNDVLKIIIPYTDNPDIKSVDIACEILYEDDDVICINKPRNLASHPSAGHRDDSLYHRALYYLRATSDEFHIVTRLDSYTSGIVLAAKNAFSASIMCTRDYNSSIKKMYVGVCRGAFVNEKGIIEAPIARCDGSAIKRCVSSNGKYAKSEYRVLSQYDSGNTLVEFRLHTGRTHQIRLHASYIGHPLVDDFLYDDNAESGRMFKLHCSEIKFVHPYTGKTILVKAKIPDYFNC